MWKSLEVLLEVFVLYVALFSAILVGYIEVLPYITVTLPAVEPNECKAFRLFYEYAGDQKKWSSEFHEYYQRLGRMCMESKLSETIKS